MLSIDLFQQQICDFARYYNRDITDNPIALQAWYEFLADNLSDEELIPAIKHAIATFHFMPSPQEFLEAFRGASDTNALEAWNQCLEEAARGRTSVRELDFPPEAKIAISKIGGLLQIGNADEWQRKELKERFLSEFKELSLAPSQPALPITLHRTLQVQ